MSNIMDIEDSIKKEALRRGYSPKTIKSYSDSVNKFFRQCNKEPSKVSKVDVKEYLNKLSENGKCGNTLNVNLNALKFFFEQILNKNMKLNIKYSKKPKRLPIVLTKEEIKKLFKYTKNEKHKLLLQTMYSTGLRVSELINLKIKDLEIEKDYGFVRQGKGKKDRVFIISEKLKRNILELIKKEKLNSEDYLFKTNRKDKYNISSIQQIIKKSSKLANIKKKVHPHTLRHSFATHLIENGHSVTEVQSLLGHQSPETTMVYIHIANPKRINIKSPFDNL